MAAVGGGVGAGVGFCCGSGCGCGAGWGMAVVRVERARRGMARKACITAGSRGVFR